MGNPKARSFIPSIAADAAGALVVELLLTLIVASLASGGVVTMNLAIFFLILAWIVGVGGTFLIAKVWPHTWVHKSIFGVVLAALLGLVGWYEYVHQPITFAATTSPTATGPSTSGPNSPVINGNCNNTGTNSGTICPTITQAPPPDPWGLYQNNTSVGTVIKAIVYPQEGKALLSLIANSAAMDFSKTISFRKYTFLCQYEPLVDGEVLTTRGWRASTRQDVPCEIIGTKK